MERNTKILLGIGAVALGYYLYTKNKAKSVAQVSSGEPQEPSTPQRPSTPQPSPQKKKIVVYTCKDGKRVERDLTGMEAVRVADPCRNNGGIASYINKENELPIGVCPTGFKKVPQTCTADIPSERCYKCVKYGGMPQGMV
jgi:hypothetical protein